MFLIYQKVHATDSLIKRYINLFIFLMMHFITITMIQLNRNKHIYYLKLTKC